MLSQGSQLLAGCSGAGGERTSFREGRSAWLQRRCLWWGDPAPGTGNGSPPAASLQAPQLPAIPTPQAQRGRERRKKYLFVSHLAWFSQKKFSSPLWRGQQSYSGTWPQPLDTAGESWQEGEEGFWGQREGAAPATLTQHVMALAHTGSANDLKLH